MFTIKSNRRNGIAKELLSRVVNEARVQGCGIIQITVSNMGCFYIVTLDSLKITILCSISFKKMKLYYTSE